MAKINTKRKPKIRKHGLGIQKQKKKRIKKISKTGSKEDFCSMSIDDFINKGFENEESFEKEEMTAKENEDENDKKLLRFNISDDEDKEDNVVEESLHKPNTDLEVANLQTDTSKDTITCAIHACHAALLRVSNVEDEVCIYKVDGSSVFNGVIQLCVLELDPAVRRFLNLKSNNAILERTIDLFSDLKNYYHQSVAFEGI
ncbi:hypothetical protein FQA39_LY13396 [Lamprigera yunnana]|nr:hypothetical protein FQA39_LY13396 [Lamprigera yunnana]